MKLTNALFCGLAALTLGACSHAGHHKGHHGKMGHHDKMWEKMDADSDGIVTREEFDKKHGEMFSKMDVNGDGKITAEEHKAGMMGMKKEKKKGCCGDK